MEQGAEELAIESLDMYSKDSMDINIHDTGGDVINTLSIEVGNGRVKIFAEDGTYVDLQCRYFKHIT